jgi:uncharacterized protein (DUF2141 family)
MLADLDGDGKLDVVTASDDSDTVGVLLGSGDGKLAAQAQYATGDYPVAVALGDLDGDGRLDVVTANQNARTLSVLRGTGGGNLASKVDFATAGTPVGIALLDLNGDGKLDIAAPGISNIYYGTLGVLLGKGGGQLADHVDYAVAAPPWAIAFGDVNGDGKLDLILASSAYGAHCWASVLLGKGDGTLAAEVVYPTKGCPSSVALADLNGDGKQDIVLGSTDTVSVLLGRGDGTFPDQVDYPLRLASVSFALGDINGDGKLDVLTGSRALLGSGDGTFPWTLSYPDTGWPVAFGDVNADGKLDLVTFSGPLVNVILNSCR